MHREGLRGASLQTVCNPFTAGTAVQGKIFGAEQNTKRA